jgi:hypothetical protein
MNDSRRLQLAKKQIQLQTLIKDIKEIYEDERWAIDEIKSEDRKETAEEGHDKLDELLDFLDEADNLFDEAAQGNYLNILAKEQKRQETVRQEQLKLGAEAKQKEQAEKQELKKKEIEAFLKVCPNPDNPEGYDIDSLEEFSDWKWYNTGLFHKNGLDPIFEHTDGYKQFLKELT